MTHKVGDTVTTILTYPVDRSIVDLGDAVEVRVGEISNINGETISIRYPPKTTDEVDHGHSHNLSHPHKCNRSDLTPTEGDGWELKLKQRIGNG